jgi:hypothetical protein
MLAERYGPDESRLPGAEDEPGPYSEIVLNVRG